MISLFNMIINYIKSSLGKNRTKAKDILNILINGMNLYTKDNIMTLRTRLSSEAGKKEYTNDIIRIIQNDYDENFSLGFIKKEPSLADKINDLEFLLNQFVNTILEEKCGKNWINNSNYFTDSKQRNNCIEKSKIHKKPAWEFINFLTMVNNIILNNTLWGKIFIHIFLKSEYFIDREEIRVGAKRIWDYRSNKLAHKRSSVITYQKDQENYIESIYKIFLSIIKDNSK